MRIDDLCKSYGQPVLSHLSLELPQGGIYALMGPSGRGKTTLLHILLGLVKPDSGRVTGLEGKRCSVVFQEDRLIEFLTAAENISAVSPSGTSLQELNASLGEILPAQALPRPVKTYSGGMKRRAAIGRALLTPSDVLIMDEPLSGLDEATRLRTIAFILKYRLGRTLIFSTHLEEDTELLYARLIRL